MVPSLVTSALSNRSHSAETRYTGSKRRENGGREWRAFNMGLNNYSLRLIDIVFGEKADIGAWDRF